MYFFGEENFVYMKIKYFRKITVLFLSVVFFVIAQPKASAEPIAAWPDFPGNAFGATYDKALDLMLRIANKVAKGVAINVVNEQMNSKVGGGADGARFITDWRDALETQPEKATELQMKNLFSAMGKGAGSNYQATDGSSGYVSSMLSGAEDSILDSTIPEVINMAEYGVNNPSEIFSGNNMRAFLTAFGSTSKIGNKIEALLYAQDQKNKFEEANKTLASVQAISNSGFYPTLSNGQVITPGITIRDLVASSNGMQFTRLATAQNIEEIATAAVTRLISNTVNKGIGDAKKYVKKNYGSEINAANTAYSAYNGLKGSFGSLEVGTGTVLADTGNCSGSCETNCTTAGKSRSSNTSEYCSSGECCST